MSDPLPLDVLRYLRIQRLTPEEILNAGSGAITASKPVSARNEKEVLESLVQAFVGLLAGSSRPALELEEGLKDGKFTGNSHAAAVVSLGEQKILQAALEKARMLLAGITCAKCGTADIAQKKCGRCRNAIYCSAACSKADWPQHKKMCRPVGGK